MDYPLVFTLVHDLHFEFGATRVVSKGRALMVFDEEAWWCHGVEPGGLTASGADPAAAFVAFKAAYGGVLEDLALESKDLDEFERAVSGFVHDRDSVEAAHWERARAEIRAGNAVAEPFNGLARVVADFEASVSTQAFQSFDAPGSESLALAEAA